MPQLDDVRLDDDAPRCPNCAKRISAEATHCPACGYELLPRRTRIRCKRCGSRIPADATTCPRCHGDPRQERVPSWLIRGAAIFVAVLVVLCLGWIIFRVLATNLLARVWNTHPPTTVPTRVIHVVQVVATPVPPTPTGTATLTPTPTARFSPTPTRRGARTAPPALTATPTLPPGFYPLPQLLAPANLTVYEGANANIVLEWLPVTAGALRENEWYEIKLTFTARGNVPGEYRHYTKETRWTVSTDWRGDLSPDARSVQWIVTVVRVEGLNPFASLQRAPISAPSASRTFIWN
jgi:RNA polymerase subunit RPABC4/transcription elongation factor Spt4